VLPLSTLCVYKRLSLHITLTLNTVVKCMKKNIKAVLQEQQNKISF
jgi:hypothetical protein